jgi:4-hydroxy-tetrahydrodipicolinate synthase
VLFETEVIHKLVSIPTVAGLKEASFDALRFTQVKTALQSVGRPIALLNGNDNFIYEALALGADGALLGFGTLGTAEQVEMLAAVKRRDYATAQDMGERLQPLADVIFAPPVTDYRARTKYALSLLGVIENTAVRPPLLPLSEAECERVRAAMEQAGLRVPA